MKEAKGTIKITPVFDSNERNYRKIATAGVVQLFNTIREFQGHAVEDSKNVKDISKDQFLEMLKRSNQNKEI